MNSLAWFILNLALLLAAISSRPVMRKLSNPQLPPIEQEEKDVRESAKNPRPESEPTLQARAELPDLDDLWRKSLFCPERSESNLLESEAGETASPTAEKSDFELTGIAWIGRTGAVKPVAVIKQQKAPPPRSAARGRTTVRGRPATRTPAPAPATSEAEKPQNVIFSEGDLINDTGYTLMEINTEENSVILARGAERVELKIEFGSAASTERKSLAVTEAANRQKEREKASTQQQAATPGQTAAQAAANAAVRASGEPPAPPGAAGATAQPGRRRRPRTEGGTDGQAGGASGSAAGGASAVQQQDQQTAPQRRDSGTAPRTQQQRLQQLYRESAERRARSTQ